ncbi:hypothetical protein [Nocardia sp. NPDC049707]|uniref:hypothetical protein n=1 Tax=Nocardia sp. NPDC049707 TaxID=3154735 RepID=UPI003437C6F3
MLHLDLVRADYLDPFDQLGAAFVKPTKAVPLGPEGEWARVHGNFTETHNDWVAAGRPHQCPRRTRT